MKTTIEVADRREATAVQTAMEDQVVRSFVIVTGVLMQLPTDRARRRVLQYVGDALDEQQANEKQAQATPPEKTDG